MLPAGKKVIVNVELEKPGQLTVILFLNAKDLFPKSALEPTGYIEFLEGRSIIEKEMKGALLERGVSTLTLEMLDLNTYNFFLNVCIVCSVDSPAFVNIEAFEATIGLACDAIFKGAAVSFHYSDRTDLAKQLLLTHSPAGALGAANSMDVDSSCAGAGPRGVKRRPSEPGSSASLFGPEKEAGEEEAPRKWFKSGPGLTGA